MRKFSVLLKVVCLMMALTLLFAACGTGTGTSLASGSTEATSGKATVESTKPAEIEKMVFASVGWGEQARDQQAVEDKLNEITKAKINVEADIKIINASTYQQQLNVMIAGGEDLDLLFIPFGNGKNTMISQNQLMALDDLIANDGQDISASLGSLLDYGKSKGKTYAVPFNGSKVYPVTIAAREDILKKYNLNLDDVKSYKDLAKIFEVVKKNEPGMTCIAPNNGGDMIGGYSIGDNMSKIDTLGDNLGVLIGNDNTKLVNLYETEQYKDIVSTMRDWYKKGYILKDAATTSEVGSVMYKEGKLFSYFYVDVLDTLDNAYHHAGISQQGQPTMVKALSKPMINSSTGFYSCGISSQSKHPEAAMKWLNLMYTDAEAVNTVYWGVEGKNFVKESDGTISFAPGEENNRGYDLPFNWMFGNSALQYTFKSSGNKADYMAQRVKQNETAEISKGFGFTFNAESIQSQYTAVANVVTKYKRALETGSVDPEVELPNFIKDLKAAGVNEVIAEKQKQFDEWLAEKGK